MKKSVKKSVKKGRPVDPTSNRQLRLKELAEKRKNGTLKKGRPIVEGSARQLRIAELELKRENGTLKKGRPVDPNSKRQLRIAELAAKAAANGGKVKLGRPSTKVELVEVEKTENGIDIVVS